MSVLRHQIESRNAAQITLVASGSNSVQQFCFKLSRKYDSNIVNSVLAQL